MKLKAKIFFIGVFSLCATLFSYADETIDNKGFQAYHSPVGYWQTIDDESKKPRSIVKICELPNHKLYGRIIEVNYNQGEGPNDTCSLCEKSDLRYQEKNLGLILITDMQRSSPNSFVWGDGTVLDPHNGKVYDAKITLAENGQSLSLRGYIGVSLLGRSQTWVRVGEDQLAALFGDPIQKMSDGIIKTSQGKYLAADYASCATLQNLVAAMQAKARAL